MAGAQAGGPVLSPPSVFFVIWHHALLDIGPSVTKAVLSRIYNLIFYIIICILHRIHSLLIWLYCQTYIGLLHTKYNSLIKMNQGWFTTLPVDRNGIWSTCTYLDPQSKAGIIGIHLPATASFIMFIRLCCFASKWKQMGQYPGPLTRICQWRAFISHQSRAGAMRYVNTNQ